MARLITVTYDIVTPESAEQGDFAESGWIDDEGTEMISPAEAIKFLRREGADQPSSSYFHSGVWYSASKGENYRTGAETTHSYHLKGFTPRAERMVWDAIIGSD
jgi:hypothetical protein